MSDRKRINGNIVSWASITVKIADEQFHGFTSLSYGDARERTYVWGMGKHHAPRGRTKGKYTPDAIKLGGPKSTVQALRDRLASLSDNGTNYGDVDFSIIAQFVEADEDPQTVEIEDCVITKDAASHDEGAEYFKDEVECSCMRIRRNGLTLWDDSEGS